MGFSHWIPERPGHRQVDIDAVMTVHVHEEKDHLYYDGDKEDAMDIDDSVAVVVVVVKNLELLYLLLLLFWYQSYYRWLCRNDHNTMTMMMMIGKRRIDTSTPLLLSFS